MPCSQKADANFINVLMPIMAISGIPFYLLGWPCGEKFSEQWFGITIAAYMVASSSAWMSTGERRKMFFRMALCIQSITAAEMTNTWCFGQRAWLLFIANVFGSQFCVLKIAAPECMILQLACVFLCITAGCLGSTPLWQEEYAVRRLRDGDDKDDWYYKFIVIASFCTTGIAGFTLLPRAALRRFCRCTRTPRVEVAEDLVVGDRSEDGTNNTSDASGAQQHNTGLHSIVPGAFLVEQAAGHEGANLIDDVNLCQVGASASVENVEEFLRYTKSTESFESVDSSIAAASVFGSITQPRTGD